MKQKSEMLTQSEMDAHIANGTFRLALVGMSNAGKSRRSGHLRDEEDFMWYEVDQEIANKLGLTDVADVAQWMGEPTDPQYEENEKQYAQLEEKCTHLDHLDTGGKNLVFDTTGSVIYLSNEAKHWLHKECLVVHIDIGEDSIPTMLERYLVEPKPVSWDGWLVPQDGETEQETLARCYPLLLQDRLRQYREFAHITIPVDKLFDATGSETLDVIKSYLPE